MNVPPKRKINDNNLFRELVEKQIKDIPLDKKLQYTDLKRISKYIDSSIFNDDKCSLWTGYITNANNSTKGTYINFFFKNKKSALHRLLYSNFVEVIQDDEYLKFNCENKGKCCNVNHLKKFKYQKKEESEQTPKKVEKREKTKKVSKISNKIDISDEDRLIVDFD